MLAVIFRCLLPLILIPTIARADVVRPALIEININTKGTYSVEVRASIEALLTGIDSRYKDTRESPNAQAYDDLRVLSNTDLAKAWEAFHPEFTSAIELRLDGVRAPLRVTRTDIPEPGYTKVPRISTIYLEGEIQRHVATLDWYYPQRFGNHAVRVRQIDEANQRWHWSDWQWIRDGSRSEPFSLTEIFTQAPWYQVVQTYVIAGFQHILPMGMDHILFILGLFLLSRQLKPLLWQVTMFTIAHTITLGLAMKGIVDLPANIVEPLIALSIAYVGLENIFAHSLHKSRLLLVFAFGLLHGMGFASVLKEFGMPEDDFATALISFNIGVEFGQLSILLLAFAVVGFWFRRHRWYRTVVIIPGSAAIALTGLYWTWERIVI